MTTVLLRVISLLVPAHERVDWRREWEAEIAHARHPRRLSGPANPLLAAGGTTPRRLAAPLSQLAVALRCLGALEDAFWLRIHRRNRGMVLQDVRYAVRSFAKNPVFTLVVLVTLALGIGANTAIFTLVDVVLLRPLPVQDPDELVDIWTTCRRGFTHCSSSYPDYLDYRDRNRTLLDVAAFSGVELSLVVGDRNRIVQGSLTSGNYFGLLGVAPFLGRLIVPGDDERGRPEQVAILSYRFWSDHFGGDPGAVGREILLNDTPYTIVGVTPRPFRGTRLNAEPEVWIPFTSYDLIATGQDQGRDRLSIRSSRWIGGLIGRRRPGVTAQQIAVDFDVLSEQMREEFPAERGPRNVTTAPVSGITLPVTAGADVTRFVLLLMSVVGATLLIACANVANLLLARARSRRREIAVRLALGAGHGRLTAQLLTESILLAGLGAMAGLGVAQLAFAALSGFSLPGFVAVDSLGLRLDGRVLGFTVVASILTGLIFGLAPALHARRMSVTGALKDDEAGGGGVLRARSALLTAQTVLAVVLLIGAGLFVRSLRNGLATDTGFTTRSMAMLSVDFGMHRYTSEQSLQFIQEFARRAEILPGVSSVSYSILPPPTASGMGLFAEIDSYTPQPDEEIRIEYDMVGPAYFATMGIRLEEGRDLTAGDRRGAAPVVVINQTMAERWWPGANPVGRTIRVGGPDVPAWEVVGVARDVGRGLDGVPEPFVYFPMLQASSRVLDGNITFVVKTAGNDAQLLSALRTAVHTLDPNLALDELTTMHNRMAEFLMPQRMGSTLLAALGGMALVLATVGIFGVVAYAVNQRRREIGIRLALGAEGSHILSVMVRSAAVPVAIGLVAGLGAAAALTRLASTFMYDVAPQDPATFGAVAVLVVAVALLAAYLPARKATTVNPTEALRSE
jgi:predicted permease